MSLILNLFFLRTCKYHSSKLCIASSPGLFFPSYMREDMKASLRFVFAFEYSAMLIAFQMQNIPKMILSLQKSEAKLF